MGVLEAIGGLFSSVAGGVADLAGKVWTAIKSVYLFASSVFDLVGGAWDWMVNGVGWLGDNIIGGLARLLHLLEWLALRALPEGLSWAFGEAVRFVRRAVGVLEHYLLGALGAVASWARGAINTLTHWARSAVRSILHTLGGAVNWIARAGNWLYNLVSRPERLVTWILGALVLPLVKWLISKSAPILVFMFKAARSIIPTVAHTIEDALAKIV